MCKEVKKVEDSSNIKTKKVKTEETVYPAAHLNS